jgi:hypothetical protein
MFALSFLLIAAVSVTAYMVYLYNTDPAEYYWKMQTLSGAALGGSIVFAVYILIMVLTTNV